MVGKTLSFGRTENRFEIHHKNINTSIKFDWNIGRSSIGQIKRTNYAQHSQFNSASLPQELRRNRKKEHEQTESRKIGIDVFIDIYV